MGNETNSDPDRKRGVYRKYVVKRTDGGHRSGRKHESCAYFVLDLDHDEFALPALEAYAKACEAKYPGLAADIRLALATVPCGCRSVGECTHHFVPQTPAEMVARLIVASDPVVPAKVTPR